MPLVTLEVLDPIPLIPFSYTEALRQKNGIHVTLSVGKGLGVVGIICAPPAPSTDSSSLRPDFIGMTFEERPLLPLAQWEKGTQGVRELLAKEY